MKPARHGDPSTSHEAADGAGPLRKRLIPFISSALAVYGPHGAILDQIWEYVRERTVVQGRDSIGPRMVEMERLKLVCRKLTGYTEKGDPIYRQRKSERTGRSQEIWWDSAFEEKKPDPKWSATDTLDLFAEALDPK